MSTYVLVHGAWMGSWCWEKVASQLRAGGHTVLTPELPAHGADQTPAAQATLDSYVTVVDRAIQQSAEPVVLVGHSMGGAVISQVAERSPDRIAALIYVAGYLLESGQTIVQASQGATDSVVGANMEFAPDYSTVSVKKAALRDAFAADATEDDFARLEARARPEPTGPFNTPVSLTAEGFGRVPRRYISTALDRAVTPMLQSAMLAKSPCERVVTMNTGHTPFLSAPVELAANLVALSQIPLTAGR